MKKDKFLFDVINLLYDKHLFSFLDLASPDVSKVEEYCKLLAETRSLVFAARDYLKYCEDVDIKKSL